MSASIEQLKDLYCTCFPEDSEAYVNYVFGKGVLNEDNVVTVEENGSLTGALYLLPKRINYRGHAVDFPFISAVGVYPQCRGRGVARQVIAKALNRLKESGVPFVSLYPVNTHIYSGMGFRVFTAIPKHEGIAISEPISPDRLMSIYEIAVTGSDFFEILDKKSFQNKIDALAVDDELPTVFYDCNRAVGFGLDIAAVITPVVVNRDTHGHMARVVDLAAAMRLSGATLPFAIRITDDMIAENNQTFTAVDGVIAPAVQPRYTLSIADLTVLLFGLGKEYDLPNELNAAFPRLVGSFFSVL